MSKLKEILERIIKNGFVFSSEIYHEELCFYCGASVEFGENHESDCFYVEAKNLLEQIKIREQSTEENFHAPGFTNRQEEVTICGKTFWADPELIPLLTELNKAGLITRSHCAGHSPGNHPWIVLRMDNILLIEVRNKEYFNEVVIAWQPFENINNERNGIEDEQSKSSQGSPTQTAKEPGGNESEETEPTDRPADQ